MLTAICWWVASPLAAQTNFITVGRHQAHPTRLLAKFADANQAAAPASAAVLHSLGLTAQNLGHLVPGLVTLDMPDAAKAAATDPETKAQQLIDRIAALRNSGLFAYVEPDYVVKASLTPNDSAFVNGTLWGLRNNGQLGGRPGADINAVSAWDITTGSTNVIVAVIDTGIRYTHLDLAAQMWRNPGEIPGNQIDDDNNGYVDDVFGINAIDLVPAPGDPMDDIGHGTHVAGTIGAAANNGQPHVGVAWQVQLMACKFLGASGGLTSDAIECIGYAARNRARIMNNSWGGYGYSQALFDSIAAARTNGILFVAAAGNDANDNDVIPAYPASYQLDNIVAVAAVDRYDKLAVFSNYGLTNVHLAAPGVDIFSTYNGSDTDYQFLQGTSMASPHVAGVAALVVARYPAIPLFELVERLMLSAVQIPALTNKCRTEGRVNAYNALTGNTDGILEIGVTPPSGTILLQPSTNVISARVSDLFGVTDATVTGLVPGLTNLVFQNDGVLPDLVAGDAIYTTVLRTPSIGNSLTLTVTATAPGKIGISVNVTYPLLPRPSNDDFANAIKIRASGDSVVGNNKFASMESQEPLHARVPTVENSVWWNFSPSISGRVLVDTTGSALDTVIGVYTGTQLGQLVEVASTNDVGQLRQGYLTFNAQATVTYYIAVAGTDASQAGEIRLRVEPGGLPDTTAPSVAVTSHPSGGTVFTNQITLAGTATDPKPNASGVSQVFVRLNNDLTATPAFGTTNWSAPVLLQAGLNRIEVWAVDFARNTSFPLVFSITYREQDAPNDLFANATLLSGLSGTAAGNNSRSSKEQGEPAHAGNEGGKSIWWKWQAPSHGVLFLSTAGSTFDTLLGLYSGDRVTNLIEVASSDDTAGGQSFSELIVAVQANQLYRIAVDGFASQSGEVRLLYAFTSSQVFTLTASNTVEGVVTPSSGSYPGNATVSLTAKPNRYFEFGYWANTNGQVLSAQNPFFLTLQSHTNVVPHFSTRVFADDFQAKQFTNTLWKDVGWQITNFVVTNVTLVTNASKVVTNKVVMTNHVARSANIGHGRPFVTNSVVLVSETPAGSGSFEYRVSSEAGFDKLEFHLNGLLLTNWSGETGWNTFAFDVPEGSNVLEWRYVKDAAVSEGEDAAFIDKVDLPAVAPPFDPSSLSLAGIVSGSQQIRLRGQPYKPYVVQASADLKTWKSISTNTANNAGEILFQDAEAAGQALRFYRAFKP